MRKIAFILLFIPLVLNGQFIKKDGKYITYEGSYIRATSGQLIVTPTLVTGITVSSTDDAIEVERDNTLAFAATVTPSDATDKRVVWSVYNNTGSATITQTGILTGVSNGTVEAIATARDGSGVADSLEVTVIDPVTPGDVWVWDELWSTGFESGDNNGWSLTTNIAASTVSTSIGQSTITSSGLGYLGNYNVAISDIDAVFNETGGATWAWDLEYITNEYGPNAGFSYMIDASAITDSSLNGEKWFMYNFLFKPGGDWALEVKMPGINCAEASVSFDTPPADTDPATPEGDAFSLALLLRGGANPGTYNQIAPYLWFPGRTTTYGLGAPRFYDPDDWGTSKQFDLTDSTWYSIAIRVVPNTVVAGVPNEDGAVQVFLNEKLTWSLTGIILVTDETSYPIDWLRFYSFYGGGSASYAPSTQQWILYDDLYFGKPNIAGTTMPWGPGNYFSSGDTIDSPIWPKQ